jgi:serine protease Do
MNRWQKILSSCVIFCAASLANPRASFAQAVNRAPVPDPLHQFSDSLETLIRRIAPSVVQISVTSYGPLEQASDSDTDLTVGRSRKIGSGVIIDPDGYIITNAHVVKGAETVQVIMPAAAKQGTPAEALSGANGSIYDARIVGVTSDFDLALIKIEATGLQALPLADYQKIRQGQIVLAIGSPEGLRNSVTMGVVSAVARQTDPDSPMVYIQTDAPINPGNSGGPLVNVDGEVVGIDTLIVSSSGGNEGLGFAIPSAVVAEALPQLKKYGHIHKGEIGASVQSITPILAEALNLPRGSGVLVSDVDPDGPAGKAGLHVQDILLSADGREVDNLPMFAFYLMMHRGGESVDLTILRGTQTLDLKVPVVEPPHNVDHLADEVDSAKNLVSKLGILGIEIDSKIQALLPDLRNPTGIIVAAKAAGAGGEQVPLSIGDVIHAINGAPVSNLDDLRNALKKLQPGAAVALQVERDGHLTYVGFQME